MFTEIDYEVRSGIATITLNRPDQLNRFTSRMRDELVAAYDQVDSDDTVGAVVVTGAGRAFCAGADLSRDGERFGLRDATSADDHEDRGGVVTMRMFRCLKPIVAAVNGVGVGFGATMTLAADVRLFSAEASLRFPFARLGIVPEAASAWFLPRLVGISRALEWCCSGRVVPAEEALEVGLARGVYTAADLPRAAREVAGGMSAGAAPVSVAATRRMMWQMLATSSPAEAHAMTSRIMFELGNSADCAEGMAAFRERRPPRFSMVVSHDLPKTFTR